MKHRQLTATRLRLSLAVSLFAIPLIAGGLFYVIYGQLQGFAVDVSHKIVDAGSSQTSVQTLQQIQRELEDNKDVVAKAKAIVADSQSYQYQDQILSDINNYAAKAGITISNVDFSAGASSSTTSRTGTQTQTQTPAPTTPSGVKTVSVSVTMVNPIGYGNFLQFLRSLEDNLTKMQVQRISLSKGASGGSSVASDVLTIQVYVR
ncbi:MAG TPA: hypothetical protein VIQ80_02415 [Candidatus Saccharimonadales bacterium]